MIFFHYLLTYHPDKFVKMIHVCLELEPHFFLYFLRNFCTAYTADVLSDCVNVIVHFAYAVEPHPTGTNLSYIFRF